jgi:predicted transcriptional regulator
MDTEVMVIATALASYVAGWASNWWMQNRKSVLSKIENKLEDTIEEVTGLDVELSDAVEEVASSAEEIVSDVADAIEDGASLEEIKDTIVESAQEEAFEMVEELSNMKVSELRDKLRDVGLPVDGKKAELVTRLAEYLTESE